MDSLFYLIPLAVVGILFVKKWITDFVDVTKAIISNSVNIFILLLIGALISMMDQGRVLPVDMFFGDPTQIVLNNLFVLLFIFFLALILSLYPIYIEKTLFVKSSQATEWYMTLWGIITYVESGKIPPFRNKYWHDRICSDKVSEELKAKRLDVMEITEDPEDGETKKVKSASKHFRVLSGLSLFILWSWVLVYIYAENWSFEGVEGGLLPNVSSRSIYFVNIMFSILLPTFYVFLYNRKRENQGISEERELENSWYIPLLCKTDAAHRPQSKALKLLYILVLSTIIIWVIHLIFVYQFNWSLITIVTHLLVIYFLAAIYLIIRVFRRQLYIRFLSEDSHYLSSLRIFGILLGLYMLLLNVNVSIAESMSPLTILLGGIILVYTAIILPLKLRFYLDENQKKSPIIGWWKNPNHHYGIIIVLLLIIIVGTVRNGNNLHRINADEELTYSECNQEKFNPGDLDKYYSEYRRQRDSSESWNLYYTAYGGGLKANAWNLRILNLIDSCRLSSNVINMSGVSGGSMGIANYALSRLNKEQTNKVISKISNFNVLGVELSWLLGWDWIREFVPHFIIRSYEFDRSRRAMKFYSNQFNEILNDNTDYFKEPFDVTYQKIRRSTEVCFFPNMIFNSTSLINKYGVVSAHRRNGMFPGGIDLLERFGDDTKQISYLDAVSTSNRFPVISPAAHIEGKGIFVDGGYFENSALLSTLSYMRKIDSICLEPSTVIQVTNSKENYIEEILSRSNLENIFGTLIIKEETPSELVSILSGAINLERHPRLLRELLAESLNDSIKFKRIGLPFFIQMEDVWTYFGGEIVDPILRNKIEIAVTNSNNKILVSLNSSEQENSDESYLLSRWGIIPPPTSRVLSRPAVLYLNAIMKYHPDFQVSTFEDYIRK